MRIRWSAGTFLLAGWLVGTGCSDEGNPINPGSGFPSIPNPSTGGDGDGDGVGDGDGDGDGNTDPNTNPNPTPDAGGNWGGNGDGDGDGDGDTNPDPVDSGVGDGDGDGDGDAGVGGGDGDGDGDGDVGGGGTGECCADGNCLCHGPVPNSLTADRGPFKTQSYSHSAGCIYYPTDAEPPFAAVAVSDGFLGSGGCGRTQTNEWGPLYASWGIVTMIINTTGSDQPNVRGRKLSAAIEAFKAENQKSGSPLYQKLAGRYGTSGFSMGGGGTTYAAAADPSLRTSVAIMPWGPTQTPVKIPTLIICGSSDGIAPCGSHGTPYYGRLSNDMPKMRVEVSGGHNGQPSAGGSASGRAGLAFQKVFLEGDERWRPLLLSVRAAQTTIK